MQKIAVFAIFILTFLISAIHPISAHETPETPAPASSSFPTPEPIVHLTLKECIEMAMVSHPDLIFAYAQLRAARAIVGQAFSAYYPQINFTSTYSRSGGPDRSTFVNTGDSNTSVAGSINPLNVSGIATSLSDNIILEQYITDFGRTSHNVTASQESYNATWYDSLATKNNIINNVKKAYYTCIANQELLKLRQENVSNSESHLRQSQAFYSVGKRAKIEVTKSEVDLATARLDMIKADNAYRVSRMALINAIGLKNPINFELARNLILPEVTLSLEELLKITSENRPEYLKAEAQIRVQKARLAEAIASFYPTLTGNVQYSWHGSDYPLKRYWHLGVILALPITDGNFKANVVKQNSALLEGFIAQKERLWQNISFEVGKAYFAVKDSRERINVSEKSLSQAQENFKLAKGRYDVGVGTNLEYNDAQVAHLQAKTNYISALVDYYSALADLEKSIGVELNKLSEEVRSKRLISE